MPRRLRMACRGLCPPIRARATFDTRPSLAGQSLAFVCSPIRTRASVGTRPPCRAFAALVLAHRCISGFNPTVRGLDERAVKPPPSLPGAGVTEIAGGLPKQAMLGLVEHCFCRFDLVIGAGRRWFNVDNHCVFGVDQIIEPIAELNSLIRLCRPRRAEIAERDHLWRLAIGIGLYFGFPVPQVSPLSPPPP
jgi:hypothetical protein